MNIPSSSLASPANNSPISRIFIAFLQIAFTGIAYFVLAKIGTFLVIPPGQASILWPAAGVALACAYVFGVNAALGIFIGAMANSLSYYSDIHIAEILTAATIATGTALQAMLGTFLAQKFYKQKALLGNLKDTAIFMLLTGPIACLTNAFIATTALLYKDAIALDEFATHSFSWWMGDVFGVVAFAPLLVILLSRAEHGLSLKRKLIVAAPMIVSLFIFIFIFNTTKNEFSSRSYQEYTTNTQELVTEFAQGIATDIANVRAVAAFFNASEYVSAKEFRIFTEPLLRGSKGVFGLSWLPKVTLAERDSFIETIRSQGFEDYTIKERAPDGTLTPSRTQDVYFPLAYTEPYEQNKIAHGFDVYARDSVAQNKRRQELDNARDTGEAQATARFSIVQKKDEYGFIIYFPVYASSTIESINERREKHIGYINGIFTFPQLSNHLLESVKNLKSDFVLKDITSEDAQILFDSRTSNFKEGPQASYDFTSTIHAQDVFNVAGKKWEITFLKNSALLSESYLERLWYYVIAGIILNVLLLIILTSVTARNDYIESLVKERTDELKHANEELEEFAYRTSHDLRSPLVSSINLLKLSDTYIRGSDNNKALEAIALSIQSLNKLEALVADILSLTQTKNAEEENVKIDINAIINDSLKRITYLDGYEGINIFQDLKFNTDLHTKESRLRLIVENLLSNAVKYHDQERKNQFIRIITEEKAGMFILHIEDNGLGIPERNQKQLFQMFKRFHTKTSFGSGLGLYMIQKSVDILSGSIQYTDTGQGSKFTLKLPLKK